MISSLSLPFFDSNGYEPTNSTKFENKQIFTLNYSYVFCFLLLVFCCCFYYTVNWDIMAVVLAGLFGASLENAKIKHAKK
jgi:hypothetical protein